MATYSKQGHNGLFLELDRYIYLRKGSHIVVLFFVYILLHFCVDFIFVFFLYELFFLQANILDARHALNPN